MVQKCIVSLHLQQIVAEYETEQFVPQFTVSIIVMEHSGDIYLID